MKKVVVNAKSVNSNFELKIRNNASYNKRLMAYAQAKEKLGKTKAEKK